jgi:hypothetical protein
MKKLIDIPDELLKDLKILAVKEGKDLKNFIQDNLKSLVEKSKREVILTSHLPVDGIHETKTVPFKRNGETIGEATVKPDGTATIKIPDCEIMNYLMENHFGIGAKITSRSSNVVNKIELKEVSIISKK